TPLGPGIGGVLAREACDRCTVAVLMQPILGEPGEGEAAVGKPETQALDTEPDGAGDGAEIGTPVVTAPDFMPVDDQAGGRAAEPQGQPGAQQVEVREGGGVDCVVAPPMPKQMPEHSEPEAQRGPDPPPAGGRVEIAARGDGQRLERRARALVAPLAPGEVGDRVTLRQPLGEVAIPALGPTDRVREEAVVDDRDLHRARSGPRAW